MSFIISFLHLILTTIIGISHAQDACDQTDKKKFLKDIVEHEACRDLNVGEKKIVNFDRSSSPSLVEHKYILEKVKPDEYRVQLNLHFKENQIFPDKPTKVGRRMQTRINKCLKEMNPKLLGPHGEKIKIELVPWAEKNLPKYKEIKSLIWVTEDQELRANSHLYNSQSDCSTILHELLHLLGLADEYRETEYINSFEKDCRSYGPEDSVMHDHSSAGWELMRVQTCLCDDSKACNTYSKEEIKNMKSCPSPYGTSSFNKYFLTDTTENGERVEAKNVAGSAKMGISMGEVEELPNSFKIPPQSLGRIPNSVFYPAQYRAIIFPGCQAKNAVYYGCARDSYYRPWKFVGSCNQKPAACNDEREWLK